MKEHLLQSGFAKAMEGGALGMLNVGATCAGAGIIVGVVTLTGLGLKFSSIVIDYAQGSLLLTAIFTALVVWIVGLAVPVTASYIICAVIAAPALIKLGVPDFAAHMFIFYYAVLSEVSPPTALVALRRRGDHRRRPVQDDAAVLEVHRAGLPAAVHVRARPLRPGPAADGLDQGAGRGRLAVDRPGDADRRARHRRHRRRLPGLGAAPGDRDRARACSSSPASRSPTRAASPTWSACRLVVAVLAMQRFLAAPPVLLSKDG